MPYPGHFNSSQRRQRINTPPCIGMLRGRESLVPFYLRMLISKIVCLSLRSDLHRVHGGPPAQGTTAPTLIPRGGMRSRSSASMRRRLFSTASVSATVCHARTNMVLYVTVMRHLLVLVYMAK
jgi:hypothetical protein